MNKLVEKYSDLLKSGKMTKVQINSMRKALGMCSTLTEDEKTILVKTFWECVEKKNGIKITKEHTEQGLHYLKGLAWTKTGTCRSGKSAPFGIRERSVLAEFKEFRLMGLDEIFNPYASKVQGYRQVWRVIAKNGAYFEYVQGSGKWGGIEVIG